MNNNSSTEILTVSMSVADKQCPPPCPKARKTQQILVSWDRQKSYTFMVLSFCFLVWACIFFPLNNK